MSAVNFKRNYAEEERNVPFCVVLHCVFNLQTFVSIKETDHIILASCFGQPIANSAFSVI